MMIFCRRNLTGFLNHIRSELVVMSQPSCCISQCGRKRCQTNPGIHFHLSDDTKNDFPLVLHRVNLSPDRVTYVTSTRRLTTVNTKSLNPTGRNHRLNSTALIRLRTRQGTPVTGINYPAPLDGVGLPVHSTPLTPPAAHRQFQKHHCPQEPIPR